MANGKNLDRGSGLKLLVRNRRVPVLDVHN